MRFSSSYGYRKRVQAQKIAVGNFSAAYYTLCAARADVLLYCVVPITLSWQKIITLSHTVRLISQLLLMNYEL